MDKKKGGGGGGECFNAPELARVGELVNCHAEGLQTMAGGRLGEF